jgi:2-(1,2-epoxy-1,2-dihydrophenyl)acetyl-CoA isomerase
MNPELVKTSIDGPVMVIRLSSPEDRNALSMPMRQQIGDAVERAEQDRSVRAVFLTADGPSFCAGGDLRLFQSSEADPWFIHRRFRHLSRWLIPLTTLDKPVVVGVRGHAVGGGFGLALAGDRIIAGQGAQFVTAWFRIGSVPDIGVMFHLPRLIGMARARNLFYDNATLTAQQALDLGIACKVVPDDEVDAAGLAEAHRLAEGPAEVMGLAKTLMLRSFETTLADMAAYEGFGQVLAQSSAEFREGVAAVVERRRPDFTGAAKR